MFLFIPLLGEVRNVSTFAQTPKVDSLLQVLSTATHACPDPPCVGDTTHLSKTQAPISKFQDPIFFKPTILMKFAL